MTHEEPEAYKDDTLRSIGISPRERLGRIEDMLSKMDEKLDTKFEVIERRVTLLEIASSIPITTKQELDGIRTILDNVRARMWMAVGGLGVLMVVINIGIAKSWF